LKCPQCGYIFETGHRKGFQKPTIDELGAYIQERGLDVDPDKFWHFYESKGWVVGKSPMKNWKSAIATWTKSGGLYGDQNKEPGFAQPKPGKYGGIAKSGEDSQG
jgi:hypothetical protein